MRLFQQRIEELRNLRETGKGNPKGMVITVDIVWNHSDAVYRQCEIPEFDCKNRLMRLSGASQEALNFLKRDET